MTVFELKPNDHHKSFHGKAIVIKTTRGGVLLKSYDTIVCEVNRAGRFVRHWGGYSATTMRHINAFLAAFGVEGGGKAWWDALPVEKFSYSKMC